MMAMLNMTCLYDVYRLNSSDCHTDVCLEQLCRCIRELNLEMEPSRSKLFLLLVDRFLSLSCWDAELGGSLAWCHHQVALTPKWYSRVCGLNKNPD